MLVVSNTEPETVEGARAWRDHLATPRYCLHLTGQPAVVA
jgi:hypothetical protein